MAIIQIGQRFGRLTIVGRDLFNLIDPSRYWCCLCDCGTTVLVRTDHLNSGNTRSCGCIRKEIAKIALTTLLTTHGDSYSSEYNIYNGMIQRCTNPKSVNYEDYGGRGIDVCGRWRESYLNFLEDMDRRPSPEHSIERLDNDGDYEPGNCVWATRLEQANNKRSNRNIVGLDGKLVTVAQAARDNDIGYSTLTARLNRGMTVEEALATPMTKLYDHDGFSMGLKDWSDKTGISLVTLWQRVNQLNWSIERALTAPLR